MSLDQILRIMRETEATPHHVVTKIGDIKTILAEGSEIEVTHPWGKQVVTVGKDGEFEVVKSGPNTGFDVQKFGKLRRNGAVMLGEVMVSCEPIGRN